MGRGAFQGTRGSNRALAAKKQYEDALREKFFDDFMAPVELIGPRRTWQAGQIFRAVGISATWMLKFAP
jgi:hypothetical protein